jgi:hypothetical protein
MMPQTVPVRMVPRGPARPRGARVAWLLGLALSLAFVTGAQAATTWTVCASGCDYTSIKAAIAAPTTVNGDTLAIAAGTYTEAGIIVDKSLTLQGEKASTTIVQAAEAPNTATDRVFTITSGVAATLQALTIRHGRTTGDGGGIWNSGTLTLTNMTIRGNRAYSGGGIANQNRQYTSILTMINTTLSGNTAELDGGGLYSLGVLIVMNATINGNTAGNCGGGLSGWALTLTNVTLSGNRAAGYCGGGIDPWSPMALTHTTISGNSAPFGGGLFVPSNVTLTHSIIADNDGGDCAVTTPLSKGYNLDSDGSCQLAAPTDLPGAAPLLGPLQKNGGLTFTHALLPGSPAIDAIPWGANGCGTTLISDQRWQARPQPAGGACDIGAYEVEVPGQAFGGWVSGFTPGTVVCQNVSTEKAVTLNAPASPWDCEAAGLAVTPGDQVALRVRGLVTQGATDVGGAVAGIVPSGGSCTNLTTGQQVPFQALFQGVRGATAASCVAAGLVVHPGNRVQISVQGNAE